MEILRYVFAALMTLYQIPINIFGFSFSLWQVFVFFFVLSILILVLSEVFYGD